MLRLQLELGKPYNHSMLGTVQRAGLYLLQYDTELTSSHGVPIGALELPEQTIASLGAATAVLRELGLLDLQWRGEQLPATPAPDRITVKAAKLVRQLLKPKQ